MIWSLGNGEAPEFVHDLELRRLLWRDYGVPFADITPGDIYRIIDFHNGEAQREKNNHD